MTPKYGDHIKVKIDSFYHHGIFVSKNEVIHFCSDEKFSILSKNLEIQATSLLNFAHGNKIEIVEYNNRYGPDKTVELARGKIGDSDYDLTFNNCEHFAYSCTTGHKTSKTMDRLKRIGIRIERNNGINGLLSNLNKILIGKEKN